MDLLLKVAATSHFDIYEI